jgi:hypothetical protein
MGSCKEILAENSSSTDWIYDINTKG